ncbi:hypothetical protein CPB86DRAFT_747657, partial [Serendipita vermifera]
MTMWDYGICIANLYRISHEADRAKEILETCYRGAVKIWGENHRETVEIKLRIVGLYEEKGQLLQAEQMLLRIQESYQRRLGPYPPYIRTLQHKLASVYLKQGRLLEAEELLVNLLVLQKKTLGDKHRHTLHTVESLAQLYIKQQHWSKAEILLQQSYDFRKISEAQKSIVPRETHQTVILLIMLVVLCKNQGRLSETEILQKEIIGVRTKLLGNTHPDTLTSVFDLSEIYMDQSRFKEAAQLQSDGLKLRQKLLGPNHPDTIEARVWLAFSMFRQ